MCFCILVILSCEMSLLVVVSIIEDVELICCVL